MHEVNQQNPTPEVLHHEHGEYHWGGSGHAHNHAVLLPALSKILGPGNGKPLLDLGCGNGSLSAAIARANHFVVTGTEFAAGGVTIARATHPELTFVQHDLSHPLPVDLGQGFDTAISAEVIEHLLLPRMLFRRATEALRPGGRLVITTPYHGWLKNVALAVTNNFDKHWNPGWDHGHVKFFSPKTLLAMAAEEGFSSTQVYRVGRIPPLAMSMIVVLKRSS